MMVVVADAILEAGRRPCGLNAPDEPFGREHAKRVVHRLQGDRADFRTHRFGDGFGRDVRLVRDGPQHGEPLRRDLDAPMTKEFSWIGGHATSLAQIWSDSKIGDVISGCRGPQRTVPALRTSPLPAAPARTQNRSVRAPRPTPRS